MVDNILRYKDEPVKTLTDAQVHRILTKSPEEYIISLLNQLKTIVMTEPVRKGIVNPPKQIFTDKNTRGDFRLMPCITQSVDSIRPFKTVKIVGTNHEQSVIQDKITVGKALVLHHTDNYVTHIIDACALSSARTGAIVCIAALLLELTHKNITIVGCGRVGYYSALYLCSLTNAEHIKLYDTNQERAVELQAALSTKFPYNKFEVVSSIQDEADVMVVATDSPWEFVSPHNTKARTVISAGADEVGQRELTIDWIHEADIYAESDDCIRYGDMHAWMKKMRFEYMNLFELLVSGPLKLNEESDSSRRQVFITTGNSLMDNLTLRYILNA